MLSNLWKLITQIVEEKMKGPQKRPFVLTNYRTKTYYSLVLKFRIIQV